MMRLVAALALASVSCVAFGAPPITEPVEVTVTNQVLAVEVSNADPIPVTNVGETRVPFIAGEAYGIGGAFLSIPIDVPTGKRLVIETVSVYAQLPPGVNLSVSMQTFLGSDGRTIAIPVENQGVSPESGASIPKQKFAGLHAVKIWADGRAVENDVVFNIARSQVAGESSTNNAVTVTLHGYLIDP